MVYIVYKLSRFDKWFKKFDDSEFGEFVKVLDGEKNDVKAELNINGKYLMISAKLEERENTKEEPFNSYFDEEVFEMLANNVIRDKPIYRIFKWIVGFGIGALIVWIPSLII